MAKLTETAEWENYVVGVAGGGYADSAPVLRLRKEEDIADLAALVRGKPGHERDAALQVLFAIFNGLDVRPPEVRQLGPVLKEYVAAGYPGNKLSQWAWTFWRKIDPYPAGEYLREWGETQRNSGSKRRARCL